MSHSIVKEYNGDVTITIDPDDIYSYVKVLDTNTGGMGFLVVDDDMNCKILTPAGLSEFTLPLSNLRKPKSVKIEIVREKTSYTMPTMERYQAESN